MEDMIKKRIKIIEDLKAELNELKETHDDLVEDDPLNEDTKEKEIEIREEKKAAKTRMLNNPSYSAISEDIKEKRTEIKENNEALSVELIEFYRKEGKMEFMDDDGNIKRMKFSVRLVN